MTRPARTPPNVDAGPRLLWLDALRGVAVLAVVVEHLSYFIFTDTRRVMLATADPGVFGVTLFFLISGFVVPASLERRGDPRRFWVSRFFRLYPLWAVAAGLSLAVELAGRYPLPPGFARNPAGTLAANTMMLEGLIGPPHLIGVFWTLTYEMTFYLLLSALFVWGLHTFSAGVATACAATALLAGGFLPTRSLPLPWLAAVLIAAGLAGTLRRRRCVARTGGVVLAAALLALLAGNQPTHGWEGFIILGFMFTGTAIYRVGQRQVTPATAVCAVVIVLGCAAVAAFRYGVWFPYGPLGARSWLLAVVAAFVTFGLGLALRHAQVPRLLSWLGRVSYSVYLAHNGVTLAMEPVIVAAARGSVLLQALATGLYFAVLLICCQITHRLIEVPGQTLGRRLIRRLRPADGRAPVQPAQGRRIIADRKGLTVPSAPSLQLLARLARPVKAIVRPFPGLNAALWNAQYRLGIWDYLDAETDGLEPLLLAERYTPHPAILDLGCGTSTNLRLAPGTYRRYHGVDISGKAITRARALARPECTFEVADILRYETSERYDVILLREVLYYLPVQALRDFLRRLAGWLKADGKIIIQMWSPGTHVDVIAAVRDCGLPIQEETARESGGDDDRVFLVLSGPR